MNYEQHTKTHDRDTSARIDLERETGKGTGRGREGQDSCHIYARRCDARAAAAVGVACGWLVGHVIIVTGRLLALTIVNIWGRGKRWNVK